MILGNLYGSISVHFSVIAHLVIANLFLFCFIILYVIYQSERSRVCVLWVSFLPLSTMLVFDFGIFPTLVIFGFHFISVVSGVYVKIKNKTKF